MSNAKQLLQLLVIGLLTLVPASLLACDLPEYGSMPVPSIDFNIPDSDLCNVPDTDLAQEGNVPDSDL